jgi:tRNA nucleotidyltransferase/poly(A) polymerase
LADRRALRSRPEFDDDEATLRRLAALLAAEDDEPGGRRHDLPITGDDLLGLGLKPGPQIGEILRAVEDRWIDGELAGRGEALEWVISCLREGG